MARSRRDRFPPHVKTEAERIALALSCRDCAKVPKVDQAGETRTLESGERVQIMHNGLQVVAGGYHGGWMEQIIQGLDGHHEPQEEAVFHWLLDNLTDARTFIELGAFWSYYTCWFLEAGAGRCAAIVEPDQQNLDVGLRNLALNGLEARSFLGFASGRYQENARFAAENTGSVSIPGYSVPFLKEQLGWPTIDVLHIDAEGAETEVLKSCADLFRGKAIGTVMVSTHHHYVTQDPLTHQRCLQILTKMGARILVEHSVQESYSGDGLILATVRDDLSDPPPGLISYARNSESLFRDSLYDLAETVETILELKNRRG